MAAVPLFIGSRRNLREAEWPGKDGNQHLVCPGFPEFSEISRLIPAAILPVRTSAIRPGHSFPEVAPRRGRRQRGTTTFCPGTQSWHRTAFSNVSGAFEHTQSRAMRQSPRSCFASLPIWSRGQSHHVRRRPVRTPAWACILGQKPMLRREAAEGRNGSDVRLVEEPSR